MNKPIEWKSVKRKVLELKPYDKNPRDITEQGLNELNRSISKFGLAEPIVISTENIIIGGHARWQTLKQLNVKECNCYLPNRKLTAKEIDELNIRLNKNIAGNWNFDILANEFEVDDLLRWGFNERELGNISIQEINEMEEWDKHGLDEFKAGDKEIKIILVFKTEKARQKFATDNEFEIGHKQAGTWTVYL